MDVGAADAATALGKSRRCSNPPIYPLLSTFRVVWTAMFSDNNDLRRKIEDAQPSLGQLPKHLSIFQILVGNLAVFRGKNEDWEDQ